MNKRWESGSKRTIRRKRGRKGKACRLNRGTMSSLGRWKQVPFILRYFRVILGNCPVQPLRSYRRRVVENGKDICCENVDRRSIEACAPALSKILSYSRAGGPHGRMLLRITRMYPALMTPGRS